MPETSAKRRGTRGERGKSLGVSHLSPLWSALQAERSAVSCASDEERTLLHAWREVGQETDAWDVHEGSAGRQEGTAAGERAAESAAEADRQRLSQCPLSAKADISAFPAHRDRP